MKPAFVFCFVSLFLSIVVGYSAGLAHNDRLLNLAIILTLVFFIGACICWDIEHPPSTKREKR